MGQAKLFVGLGNYVELFTSKSFFNSLAVTLAFCGDRGGGQYDTGPFVRNAVQPFISGDPGVQHGLRPAHGNCLQFRGMIFRIMLHPSIGIVNKLLGLDINWSMIPNTPWCVWPFSQRAEQRN